MDMSEFIRKVEAGEIEPPEEEYVEKDDVPYYYDLKEGLMHRLYGDEMFRVDSSAVGHVLHWASAKLTKEEAWEMARQEAAADEKAGRKEKKLEFLRNCDRKNRGEKVDPAVFGF